MINYTFRLSEVKAVYFVPKIDFFSDGEDGQQPVQPTTPKEDAFAGMQELDIFGDGQISGFAASAPQQIPQAQQETAEREKKIGAMVFESLFSQEQGDTAVQPQASFVQDDVKIAMPAAQAQQPAAVPKPAPIQYQTGAFTPPAPTGQTPLPEYPSEQPRRNGKAKPIDWSADMLVGREDAQQPTPPATASVLAASAPSFQPMDLTEPKEEPPQETQPGTFQPMQLDEPEPAAVAPLAPREEPLPQLFTPQDDPNWDQAFEDVKLAGPSQDDGEAATKIFQPTAPVQESYQDLGVQDPLSVELPQRTAFDFDTEFETPAPAPVSQAFDFSMPEEISSDLGMDSAMPIDFDSAFSQADAVQEADPYAAAPISEDLFAGLYDDPDDDEEDEYREKVARRKKKSKKGGSKTPLILGVVVVVVILLALLIYNFFIKKEPAASSSIAPSSSEVTSLPPVVSSVPPVVEEPVVEPVPVDEWYMRVVNRSNVMSSSETVETGTVGSVKVDARIVDALNSMIAAAKEGGANLQVIAGYRTYARQASAYSSGSTDIPAGASEHNLGLSVDIMAVSEHSYNVSKFEATTEYEWLRAHAAEYGFILRYPSDKTDVTGFDYEPWHYRYVGVDQAQKIVASGLTMEEYVAQATTPVTPDPGMDTGTTDGTLQEDSQDLAQAAA